MTDAELLRALEDELFRGAMDFRDKWMNCVDLFRKAGRWTEAVNRPHAPPPTETP